MSDNQTTSTKFQSAPVEAHEIVERAQAYADKGYRLIQMGCTRTPSEMDIIYSFENVDADIEHLKMTIEEHAVLPSISSVFFHSFMYENEIHDLYGITFTGMAIDFGGNLLETAIKYPYSLTPKIQSKKREENE